MNSTVRSVVGTVLLMPLLLAVLYALAMLPFVAIMFLFRGLCANELVTTASTSQHTAELYDRNCGATTDFVGVVKIDGRSVFTSNHYRDGEILLRWIDDDSLQIEYSGSPDNIFKNKDQYKEVNIHIIQKASTPSYW